MNHMGARSNTQQPLSVPDRAAQQRTGRSPYWAEALGIIEKAVRQRAYLLATGQGHAQYAEAAGAIDRLRTWLRYNPHPSGATLRTFWRGPMGNDLRTIVVHTPAGQRALQRLAWLASNTI